MMNGWLTKEEDGTYKLFYEIDGKGKPYKLGNTWTSMYANMKPLGAQTYWASLFANMRKVDVEHTDDKETDIAYPVTLRIQHKETYIPAWLVADANGRKKVVFDIDRPDCKPYKLLSVWGTSYSNMSYVNVENEQVSFEDEEPLTIWLSVHQVHNDGQPVSKQAPEPVCEAPKPKQKPNTKRNTSKRGTTKSTAQLVNETIEDFKRTHKDLFNADVMPHYVDPSQIFDDGWDGTLPKRNGLPENTCIVADDDEMYYNRVTRGSWGTW